MDPSIQEWADAMAQSGGQGGCEAMVIARDDKPFDLKIQGLTKVDDPRSHNGSERGAYDQKWSPSDLLHALHEFSYMKERSYWPSQKIMLADAM